MLRREPDDQGQETRKTIEGRRPEHWAMGTGAGIDPQHEDVHRAHFERHAQLHDS